MDWTLTPYRIRCGIAAVVKKVGTWRLALARARSAVSFIVVTPEPTIDWVNPNWFGCQAETKPTEAIPTKADDVRFYT
jgi:methylthioribose-1-phosphate isomerase